MENSSNMIGKSPRTRTFSKSSKFVSYLNSQKDFKDEEILTSIQRYTCTSNVLLPPGGSCAFI